MNSKYLYLLIFIFTLLLTSCQNYSGQQESNLVEVDTLQIGDLKRIVSIESALLGEPREIVSINEQQFAVYDHAYKKIIIFDRGGNKLDEFGNVGEGPGEWDSMSGAADLNFVANRFFTTNRGRLLFDLYDRAGNHISSISYPRYLNYSHKTVLSNGRLLITTEGREQALAAVMDLNDEKSIVHRIGTPESAYSERRNFEEERIAYTNGEIPDNDLNNALAAKGEEGYFIFMNTLGELRHYSEDGALTFKQEIPEDIKTKVFDYIIHQNREVAREHTVMPLKFAREMKLHDDLIYLFLPKPYGAVDLDFRMLVYNTNGELLKHYVFLDVTNEVFLFDFAISDDGYIYFVDVMNAEILRFTPGIE